MDNALIMEQRREWFMAIAQGIVVIPDAPILGEGDYDNEQDGE